jgi:Right handed beta helix region
VTKTAFRFMLIVIAFATMPAHAQQRVFVSGGCLDTNPCTVTQPYRTFQQAYNTAGANGEIDVLDPAGYGPLTITHGISIQAHGFGGITQTNHTAGTAAITISVTTSDPVTLNGLLIDGGGTGQLGIHITSGPSVQILNCVIRHFDTGIFGQTTTSGGTLLVEDTIASDNGTAGINLNPSGGGTNTTLNRTTANNNGVYGLVVGSGNATIANSVLSNNSNTGLFEGSAVTWLTKTVISGNSTGLQLLGTTYTYGDNYMADNESPGTGTLTPVSTQ